MRRALAFSATEESENLEGVILGRSRVGVNLTGGDARR